MSAEKIQYQLVSELPFASHSRFFRAQLCLADVIVAEKNQAQADARLILNLMCRNLLPTQSLRRHQGRATVVGGFLKTHNYQVLIKFTKSDLPGGPVHKTYGVLLFVG
jgi:hypothetical protein